MNLYYELLQKPVFTMNDVEKYYDNINSARSAIQRLKKEGLVVKIRNNLYTCINGQSGTTVADKYQIACRITDSSYISHHSAMEYHGFAHQMYFEVYVSSDSEFKTFDFDGNTYRYIKPKIDIGIEKKEYSGGVTVTDIERTILDSIKDMDWISGVEEVINCIDSIGRIDEDKLVRYLELYDNQFLYQKTGYLLSNNQKQLDLSDSFFSLCKEKSKNSIRYISSDYKDGKFDSDWNLVVSDVIVQFQKDGEDSEI